MNILICGADGFIGAALASHLEAAGHRIVRAVRTPRQPTDVRIDYLTDTSPEFWRPRLRNIDVVINAVGLLQGTFGTLDRVHRQSPIALFEACIEANIEHVLQISALGVDQGDSPYFRTKAAADRYLLSLPINGRVLRPALIYGPDGTSAGFFRLLASLPVIGLPGGGQQGLQPIHIDDLCRCVVRVLDGADAGARVLELAGPQPTTWRAMLASYRQQMGFVPALAIPMPDAIMRSLARLAQYLPGTLLTPDTWRMLSQGNVSQTNAAPTLLGEAPRAVNTFIPAREQMSARLGALASWRPHLMRLALAFVWFATAWVSAFVYPIEASLQLLAAVGLTGAVAKAALMGAIALDFSLGLATLIAPGRRLWWAQIGLILAYSLVIAVALPAHLAHPFGPVIKNVPIIALLFILAAEETRP